MEQNAFPYKDKLKSFIIQYAFRIPIRKELDSGEKETLRRILKDLDSEHFQLFEEDISRSRSLATLLQVIRQLPIGAATIMVPSFVFTRESFSFIWPVYMMNSFVLDFKAFDTSNMNRKMSAWVINILNAIDLRCQRTGKIYEIILGPFTYEEKRNIFENLFSIDLGDVGELNLTFARYIASENFIYNIQTNINYLQPALPHPFDIRVRVDINNRELKRSMEPTLMQKVWNFADHMIIGQLENLLKV